MMNQLKLSSPEKAKLHLAVEIGLSSSTMLRKFEKGSKKKLLDKIMEPPRVFEAESEEQYKSIHSSICRWGTNNIKPPTKSGYASYGQIAKTLDVAVKVIVYDSHFPDCEKAKRISKWLNAAVDTKMMDELKRFYHDEDTRSWPTTLKQVDGPTYASIQKAVRRFINEDIDEKYRGKITPVQFDDMYWEALNR